MRMRRTEFVPLFSVAVLSAVSCLAAPQQKRGFDKPLVIVAEDFGAFFKDEKNEMTKAGLEAYADGILAGGQVTHVFWCPVAGRANFDAKATEPIWAGLDNPATEWGVLKNENGVARATEPAELAANKRWAENAKKLKDAGLDPYQVWIARTREKGASPWISIRMGDTQCCFFPNHFRTPAYFAQHRELLLTTRCHGAGAVNYAFPESRAWFTRVVREAAARYKDVDGIEIDIETQNFYVLGSTVPPGAIPPPNAEPPYVVFAKYLKELKDEIAEASGNRTIKLALRVISDTNLLFAHFGGPVDGFPVDLMIPAYGDSRCPGGLIADWADRDRYYRRRRIVPNVSVGGLTAPQIAGRLGNVRGREFPGVMLSGIEKTIPPVRKAILVDGLADIKNGVRGPCDIHLPQDQHLMAWKRAAWGYVDCRLNFPWALDKSFKGEFALQDGFAAEKGVVATVFYDCPDIPETVYLNGRKPQTCKKAGKTATYVFPKDAVFGGVNQFYIPAEKPETLELDNGTAPRKPTSVLGVNVRIDM